MGYLIDSHCHLHDRQFFTEDQAEEMLKRAHEKGVKKIVCIGTDPQDSLAAQNFAAAHKDTYWTYGTHPEEAGKSQTAAFSLEGNSPRPVAVGEVGLDYHSDGYDRAAQIRLFEEMLQLALDEDLPVVFHVRNAFDDFFPVVANFPSIKGVVHSFTDSKKALKTILENTDFYVGVNGLATYSTLPTPPLGRILLETDAPFLTPAPFRGIINESGYIREIAQWLSVKLGVEFEIIERETTRNAERLYRLQNTESADANGE